VSFLEISAGASPRSRFQVLWIDIFPTPANSVLPAGQDAQIGGKMLAISASRFSAQASNLVNEKGIVFGQVSLAVLRLEPGFGGWGSS
jgi:hypothetical protein